MYLRTGSDLRSYLYLWIDTILVMETRPSIADTECFDILAQIQLLSTVTVAGTCVCVGRKEGEERECTCIITESRGT